MTEECNHPDIFRGPYGCTSCRVLKMDPVGRAGEDIDAGDSVFLCPETGLYLKTKPDERGEEECGCRACPIGTGRKVALTRNTCPVHRLKPKKIEKLETTRGDGAAIHKLNEIIDYLFPPLA